MDDELPLEGSPVENPPVDESPTDEIPRVVLAAIKDRMHARRLSSPEDPGHLQETLGTADDAVHVVDDGPEQCTIGRSVGRAPDGCVYVLVARISLYAYEQLRDGDIEPADAFSDSRDISLCAVYEVDEMVENIALVRHFPHAGDVPVEYLPSSPFLEFCDDDSPTDEDFPADENSLTDEPARAGRLRRAFDQATGAARRARTRRQGTGFPGI